MVSGLRPVSFRLRLCRVPTLRGSVGMAWGYLLILVQEICTAIRIFVAAMWAGMREVRRYLGLLRHEVARDSLGSDLGIDALRSAFSTF
jgi:hypothetical protein